MIDKNLPKFFAGIQTNFSIFKVLDGKVFDRAGVVYVLQALVQGIQGPCQFFEPSTFFNCNQMALYFLIII